MPSASLTIGRGTGNSCLNVSMLSAFHGGGFAIIEPSTGDLGF
jgi:hypothetical protein